MTVNEREQIKQAFSQMAASMMTADDVAKIFGVTSRRIRAKAAMLNERGIQVGWQVPGSDVWLFTEEDLPLLEPLPPGRPRKNT